VPSRSDDEGSGEHRPPDPDGNRRRRTLRVSQSIERLRTLRLGSTAEVCVADDRLRRLYISEEEVAIWRYGAEPQAGTARVRVDAAGARRLTADIEGLSIYEAGGSSGYLIASSQESDRFTVFERGSYKYVMSFRVGTGRIDGVTHTDGIDVTSRSLGRAFPRASSSHRTT